MLFSLFFVDDDDVFVVDGHEDTHVVFVDAVVGAILLLRRSLQFILAAAVFVKVVVVWT